MSVSEKSEGGMETLVSEKRMKTDTTSEARRGGMNEGREGKINSVDFLCRFFG